MRHIMKYSNGVINYFFWENHPVEQMWNELAETGDLTIFRHLNGGSSVKKMELT